MAWFVTDPERTPDPAAIAETLPRGTGVIFRHFGRPGAEAVARRLASVARRRGLVLLIGADAAMAARVGAAGVHLPERQASDVRRLQTRHPGWIVSVAAHSARAVRQAGAADAVLLSVIFPSRSPSAGGPLGTTRLARMVRNATVPIYALGGVDAGTARRLVATGVAGFAAVEAFRT